MIKSLFGAVGFSHDIKSSRGLGLINHFVDEKYWKENNEWISPISSFDPKEYELIVAVGNPKDRKNIVDRLPKDTVFWSFLSKESHIGPEVRYGPGSAILNNTVIVCHNLIGSHCHLNFGAIIGHDTTLGDYFTAAPGVFIGGDCKIGNRVYFGGNSSCKNRITICDDVTVGMGAVVLDNITEPGVYIGCPARK